MEDVRYLFVLLICITLGYALVTNRIHRKEPQAMDVYQGKTTLEYKIVDGVKIDSCVVWKGK